MKRDIHPGQPEQSAQADLGRFFLQFISMGESNTVVSAYSTYRHLQQYCSHPSIYCMYLKGPLHPYPVGCHTGRNKHILCIPNCVMFCMMLY